ncbi:pentatricopeptide repeat-containing protein At3g18110, chloroplastic isoform X2 [Magnolia sinica]|uniref:pentatricopeptide repeat-containing protein At3g18110, chloroplastic isoform X2 n=1 Tax=Magnolia sinica TaxID=86752 RepID=UPI0026585010|nr:pentatricopeptide repeat-containing protein At3g18110, chloroplastic isoform X2 [Magnolia sinica]XP_058084418.1 pentatricopeptide repeat-containing protein At3g18110, chloroplastic isoform X2 [Magnolia sinica]
MAHTGLLALPTPSTHRNLRTDTVSSAKVRISTVSSSLDRSSPSPSEQATAQKFNYDRASPSVRWPDLKLQEISNSRPHFPIPPTPAVGIKETDVDPISDSADVPEKTLYSVDSDEALEVLGWRSKTRAKKMTKLALKRAKDWRQRVQFLTERILNLQPQEFVADVLDDRKIQMTPTDFCFVVKWVGNSNWQRALEIYEWLNLRHWYSPSARMLATILAVLGKANQESIAEEIFNRTEATIGNVVQVYNAMMGVYARSGKFSKVQELLGLMRSRGCEPDLVSFNTMINARAKSACMPPGSALELLHEVRRSGLRPDIITYNTLISACSRGSNSEEAMKVYNDMEARNCQPDLWTYNAMISVYGRCGMAEEAERLFKELGAKGFFPDAVTYNSLLYAFARDGNVEKMEKVCEEMGEAGFGKDEMTYNTIIHMYGKQGRHDLAFQLYNDMKLAGRNPDAVTYTVLIDSLGKADQITEAANVMSDMRKAQVRPTLRTFSALICGYAKAGMRVEAEQTFDQMVRSGIKPDHLAYSIMLDILLRSSEMRKAMVLYRKMVRGGFRPDQGLYQLMLQVFTKENNHEDVGEVVKDMEELCGMNRQMILSILVKGECFDHAADMLRLDVTRGYDPDPENLSSILNSYISSGRRMEARTLLDFFKKHSSGSCHLITEASIAMLCEDHQLEAAMEEYNKMRKFGFDGNCTVYESLIRCSEETESLATSSQLLSDMKFYGVEPSANVYRSAIMIYCKLGFPETAHHWVDQAEKNGILFDDHSLHVTLIEAYGRVKQWQRSESVVGRLRQHSKVDRKVWNALIDAYATSGRYEQARAVFNTMMKDGPSPTVDSVNGLMQALIVDGRLDELYVVIQELQDMGFKISKSTILLMLDAFARAGNIFEVKKIYHGMKAAGYLPTMHLYRSMIGLLSKGKRVRDVELLVAEMEEAGFKPDLTIFNSFLRLYTSIGDFRKTTEVYRRIQEAGFKADEDTYNTLILMYSRDLRPEEGLFLLNEMKKQGLEPKLDTYKSLLSACCRQQLWEQAEDLFEGLRSKGCKLDRSVYHIMMKIYRNSGNHSKAENVLALMKEAGVEPTVATMHMLMVSFGTAGQPQEAEKVLNNLRTSGLNLSTVSYSSVIDAYLKNGDYNLGIEKLSEMKKDGVEPDCLIWTCFIRAASLCQNMSEAWLLLNSMHDTGFDLPIRLLMEKTDSLVPEVDLLLEKLGSFEENLAFNFVNSLEDLLWAFERRATAAWVFQLAIRKGVYRHDVFRVADKDWGADFRKLSAGAALVGLTLWLDHMQWFQRMLRLPLRRSSNHQAPGFME